MSSYGGSGVLSLGLRALGFWGFWSWGFGFRPPISCSRRSVDPGPSEDARNELRRRLQLELLGQGRCTERALRFRASGLYP